MNKKLNKVIFLSQVDNLFWFECPTLKNNFKWTLLAVLVNKKENVNERAHANYHDNLGLDVIDHRVRSHSGRKMWD